MASAPEPRPDAVTELVRVLREQVTHHAEHIADLESRLTAANQRIAEQHRLLAQLLEKGTLPPAVPPAVPQPAQPEPARDHVTPRPNLAPPAARPGRASAPVREAVSLVRDSPQPGRDRHRQPSRPQASAARPIKVTVNRSEVPQIGAIAGVVLQAREHVLGEPRPSDLHGPSIAAFAPTAGTVRSGVSRHTGITAGAVETTLTLDREELHRGHERLAARRWWFPFRR